MKLLQSFIKYLGLTVAVDITLRVRSRDNKKHTAVYYSRYSKKKLVRHSIVIYLKNIWDNINERDIATILAHELIHAWQEEKGFTDIHGKSFQRMARKMQKDFPQLKNKLFEKNLDYP